MPEQPIKPSLSFREPPPGFRSLDPNLPVRIYRRHLPHWRQDGATYFVSFRLNDALPKNRVDELKAFHKKWAARNRGKNSGSNADADGDGDGETDWRMFSRAFMAKLDSCLDEGAGSCVLRDPSCSRQLMAAMVKFDEERYLLGAYVVMPNHVHAIVRPFAGHELEFLIKAWKGVSARRINQQKASVGAMLWQQDTFDVIVRDPDHLANAIRYIGKNPAKAGLLPRSCPRWVRPDWIEHGYGFDDES